MSIREKIYSFLGLFALVLVLGYVGEMDYQDAVHQEREYQVMVCGGHWPNYKGIEVSCPGS